MTNRIDRRFTELDGIKGILCIFIFCYHYFTRLCGSKLETAPNCVPVLLLQYGNLSVEFIFVFPVFFLLMPIVIGKLILINILKGG